VFDPDTFEYAVRVPADQDRLGLQFQPWDVGQTFEVHTELLADVKDMTRWLFVTSTTTTTPEVTTTTLHTPAKKPMEAPDGNPFLAPRTEIFGGGTPSTGAQASTGVGGGARRLRLQLSVLGDFRSGETQQVFVSRWFPMIPDEPRVVTIAVRPANGDVALTRAYRLHAIRDSCPLDRPFFAPDVGLCAPACSDGFFPNSVSGQCEVCARHCVRCGGWTDCEICEPSRWRSLHFVTLADEGYCEVFHIPWLQVILALAFAGIVLALLVCCPLRALSPQRKGVAVQSAWRGRFGKPATADSDDGGGAGESADELLRCHSSERVGLAEVH